MNCDRTKLTGLVLGELDVEERREVERHLERCGACRAEREGLAKAQAALGAVPEVATSAERRDRAVAAMGSARAEVLERAMLRPRRAYVGWAAAAAVALAAVSWFAWAPLVQGPSYVVASGKGTIIRPEGTVAAARGEGLRIGDVVSAEEPVRLDGGDVAIELAGRSTLAVQAGQLLIERGAMRVDVRRGAVTIADVSGDRVVLRAGVFEVQVRRVEGVVSPSGQEPGVKRDSALRLGVRVEEGEALLEGPNGQVKVRKGERGVLDVNGYPRNERE